MARMSPPRRHPSIPTTVGAPVGRSSGPTGPTPTGRGPSSAGSCRCCPGGSSAAAAAARPAGSRRTCVTERRTRRRPARGLPGSPPTCNPVQTRQDRREAHGEREPGARVRAPPIGRRGACGRAAPGAVRSRVIGRRSPRHRSPSTWARPPSRRRSSPPTVPSAATPACPSPSSSAASPGGPSRIRAPGGPPSSTGAGRARQAASGGPLEPIAICCAGHGPTLVPTAADGRPVGAAVTWLDQRAGDDVAEVAARIGRSGWTVTLLGSARRVARLDPARDAATAWYLSSWDHLAGPARRRLRRPPSRTRPTRLRRPRRPRSASTRAPRRRRSGPGGRSAASCRRRPPTSGCRSACRSWPASTDAIAAFLGAGLTEVGQAIDTGGTSGGFGLYVRDSPSIPGLWTGSAPLPGLGYVGGAMAGTGKALDWLAHGALGDRDPRRDPAGRGRDGPARPPTGSSFCRTGRPSAGRSTIRRRGGAFVGLTLVHRRWPPRPRLLEAAAYAISPRGRPGAGGRSPLHRAALDRRSGGQPRLVPGEGRRPRPARHRAGRARPSLMERPCSAPSCRGVRRERAAMGP